MKIQVCDPFEMFDSSLRMKGLGESNTKWSLDKHIVPSFIQFVDIYLNF